MANGRVDRFLPQEIRQRGGILGPFPRGGPVLGELGHTLYIRARSGIDGENLTGPAWVLTLREEGKESLRGAAQAESGGNSPVVGMETAPAVVIGAGNNHPRAPADHRCAVLCGNPFPGVAVAVRIHEAPAGDVRGSLRVPELLRRKQVFTGSQIPSLRGSLVNPRQRGSFDFAGENRRFDAARGQMGGCLAKLWYIRLAVESPILLQPFLDAAGPVVRLLPFRNGGSPIRGKGVCRQNGEDHRDGKEHCDHSFFHIITSLSE